MASDAGGSIRIPASACGLVGLKPSRGRGFAPVMNRILLAPVLTYGVVTRSVRDTALFLDAIDRALPSRKLPPIGRIEGPAEGRARIGVVTDSPLAGEVDEEVRDAALAAARRCEALGHAVETIPCPYDEQTVLDCWRHFSLLARGFVLQTRLFRGRRSAAEELEPWTRGLARHATLREGIAAARRLRRAQEVSARLFQRCDVLLSPTLGTLPPPIGHLDPALPVAETLPRQQHFIPFTPIQNATGDPAISLPLAVSRSGLPIGVQLAAGPGGEARLLSLAYQLEADGAFHQLG
jgi:amidase